MAPLSSSINVVKFAGNILRRRFTFFNELSEVYKPAITRQKEELSELIREKIETARKSELARKIRVAKGYYTLEMSPPINESERLANDIKLLKEFVKKGAFAHLTVKQAWLLLVVSIEIFMWFFLGETIAKGHIVGYVIP